MKKVIFSLALLTCPLLAVAEKGISYQAVILDPKPIEIPGQEITGQPFVNGDVSLKFKIFSSTFVQEFEEVHAAKTDAYGLVNVLIGSVSPAAFSSLVWDSNPKNMQVWVSFDQGGTYTKVSEQVLTYNPMALFAETASKLSETLSIAGGGTGATTAAAARTNLGLGNVDNTADAAKPISTATQAALDTKANANDVTTALATKANAEDVTTALATKANASEVNASLATKANAEEVATAVATKANAAEVSTALATKANASDVSASLALKEDVSNKANTPLGSSTTLYPTQSAVKTYVDAQVAGATLADANGSTKGKIQLAGDLAGTAAAPTVPGLALKANASEVTAALAVKADTAYVLTKVAAATIADASSSTKGKIQLAGDLAGTAAAPTVPGLALKANTAEVNTSLALKAPIASPTFTGTVSGITKSMVGLGSVDNTTDAAKPISTATQTALDLKANAADLTSLTTTVNSNTASITSNTSDIALKANTTDVNTALALKAPLASPALSGVPTAPTASTGTNSTQIATTEYTNAAISSALSSTMFSVSTTLTSTITNPMGFNPSDNINYNGPLNVSTAQNLANGVDVLKVNQSGIANVGFGIANLYSNTTGNANTSVGYKGLYSNTSGRGNSAYGTYSLFNNTTGNANTANGGQSLFYNTTGAGNTANGKFALYSNIGGNLNTATGYLALYANTGNYNTANGSYSLYSNTIASNNTAIGYISLYSNTTGASNSATGSNSLFSNTTGNFNTANGSDALNKNTTGNGNTANGSYSLYSNTTANDNTANGYFSLYWNTTGQKNTASGGNSLKNNTTGSYNTANGSNSLLANTTGESNTSIGSFSLERNSTGSNNIAIGYYSLSNNTTAGSNTAIGNQSLFTNSTGEQNTANGYKSLRLNTGSYNTANGTYSLEGNETGTYNTAIGQSSGSFIANGQTPNTTSDYSVYLGANTKASADDAQNEVVIGYNAIGGGSNTITLGNGSISRLYSAATSITSLSDRRDKAEITSISEGIDFVKKLNPVSFTWDTRDKSKVGIKSAGFIAQELLALQKQSIIGANLDLVSENNPEKLEARYANLLPVMVKAIQEQQAIIEAQQKQIDEMKLILEKLLNEKK